ncbi:MAG: serine hydrolase [Cyclobacteriaceae bacterium]
MKKIFNAILLLSGFLILSTCENANDDSRTDDIDSLFANWDKPNSPGAAVAVIKDGEVIFKKGYGMSNLEYDIPITPASIFHIASVSKQFTAFCIVLLAQEGKLNELLPGL